MARDEEWSTQGVRDDAMFIRQFEVAVIDGIDLGLVATSDREELSIGTAEGNDLRLSDPAVSRHHCTLRTHERGLELRDHGSRNGTSIGGTEIVRGFVRSGARLAIGRTTLELCVLDHELEQALGPADRLGPLVGGSPAMRRLYAVIEQCATSAASVLVVGETGTGKELIAEAIHERSSRRGGPFVVVDCSALSPELAGSELFGHERGAFTGAEATRIGAFESADRGTIFLDEIGELPLALQPLLLRVLEARTVRRIGGGETRPIDVRVIAATHRDLRKAVNEKQFRADLFYRINVVRIEVPPLRERAGDIAVLAGHLWRRFRPDGAPPPALIEQLAAQSWPGNVRELRNAIERAALLGWSIERAAAQAGPLTYQQAKERAIWQWERGWAEQLMHDHAGNLSRAARATRMGRSHLREIVRRHGIAARAAVDDELDDD
ncbi:MAG TPA: sigma 54-interacting transcriptional regulator [Kofleriaceae bacterium]|nr:sigma 54-interacting transcriptional regulator [Kofleriaceae bacterium]